MLYSYYAFIVMHHVHIILKVQYKKCQLSSNSKIFQSNRPVGLFMKLDMLFLKKNLFFFLRKKGRLGKRKEDRGPHATNS